MSDKSVKKEKEIDFNGLIIAVTGIIIGIVIIIWGWNLLSIGGAEIPENEHTRVSPVVNTSINSDRNYSDTLIKKENDILTPQEILNSAYIKAQENSDIKYCEDNRLSYGGIQYCKFMLAQNEQDVTLCNYLDISLFDLNIAAKHVGGLGKIDFLIENNVSTKDTCIILVAYESKQSMLCDKASSDFAKQRCLLAIDHYNNQNGLIQNNKDINPNVDFEGEFLVIDIPKGIASNGIFMDGSNIEIKYNDKFYYTDVIISGNDKKYRLNFPVDYEDTLRNYFVVISGNNNEIEVKNATYIDYLKLTGKNNYVSYDYDFAYTKLILNEGLILDPQSNNRIICCWK